MHYNLEAKQLVKWGVVRGDVPEIQLSDEEPVTPRTGRGQTEWLVEENLVLGGNCVRRC